MILTALARYSPPNAVPFGYAAKPLGYTLVLSADGQRVRLDVHHDEKGKAPNALVPNIARTVKATPLLGCDNAAYVLCVSKEGEAPAKTETKHRLFVELIRTLNSASPDPIASAYLAWDDNGRPGLDEALSRLAGKAAQRLHMDLIALASEGRSGRLHESSQAQALWADLAREGKAGGESAICLSCGLARPTVSTLPQSLIGHLVPGSSQANVALASVNFGAASRGASGTGLRSAPICADCAAQAVQGFNYLAAQRESSWRSPAKDYGLIWWASDEAVAGLASELFKPEPKQIRDLLANLRKSVRPTPTSNAAAFYLLSYSGNVARFVVRQWIEVSAADFHETLADWFSDSETSSTEHPYRSVDALAASLGVLRRDQGKWVEALPHGSVEALVRAALLGTAIPANYLALALSRASAEVRLLRSNDGLTAHIARRRMEARIGLARLILNRRQLKENPMPAHLDESREDPAYIAGRLFAVREWLQAWALGDVNASIVDKYFERASADPQSVAHPLAVLTEQHLNAIRRKSGIGAQLNAKERVLRLMAQSGDTPGRLDAAGQAAWLCGYSQQRVHDIDSARARKTAKSSDPDSPLTTDQE